MKAYDIIYNETSYGHVWILANDQEEAEEIFAHGVLKYGSEAGEPIDYEPNLLGPEIYIHSITEDELQEEELHENL